MSPAVTFSRDAHFVLRTTEVAFNRTLYPFIAAIDEEVARGVDFTKAVVSAARQHKKAARYFYIDPGTVPSTFGLKREHLYPDNFPIDAFCAWLGAGRSSLALEVDDQVSIRELHALLHACGTGRFSVAQLHKKHDEALPGLVDALKEGRFLAPVRHELLVHPGKPGIYRLQHASVLFRSETTGILIDPHLHSSYEREGLRHDVCRAELEGGVDAILISHSHGDHLNYGSLMGFSAETPIIVPRVPRGSVLCEDLRGRLEEFGFTRVMDPRWYSKPIRIGDIEISVLPFYGEQPLLDGALREKDLRNWGNTYLVRTPQYTAWVLIDSGNDLLGAQREVAQHLRDRLGGIDFVLSNLRRFSLFTPFYITGTGSYWLSLPPETMARFPQMAGDIITLGPKGVAEVCAISNARQFLPYAHWFAEPGDRGQQEHELTAELARELRRLKARTQVVDWAIGARMSLQRHRWVPEQVRAGGGR